MPHRDLNVLDAAEWAARRVLELIAHSAGGLPVVRQLQKAALSVPLNMGEGFGRKAGPDRTYKLTVANGESEEAIKCLRATFRANRLSEKDCWALHHRHVAIGKMLDA